MCEVRALFPLYRAFTMQDFISYVLERAPMQAGWAFFGREHMPAALDHAIEFIQLHYNL
jgi:acyl-CoA thioesterase